MSATASGSASPSGTLPTVFLSAPVGTASSSALASGLFSSIQVSSLAGFASVNSLIFVGLPTVNIPASWFIGEESGTLGGGALGGSPVSAGIRQTVYQLSGFADAITLASGLVSTITVSNLTGSATVSVVGAGGFGSITTEPIAATVEITNFIRASVVVSERLLYGCTVSDALVRGTCTVVSRVLFTCESTDDLIGDFASSERLLYSAEVFAGVL
jgi:hypothetical protein